MLRALAVGSALSWRIRSASAARRRRPLNKNGPRGALDDDRRFPCEDGGAHWRLEGGASRSIALPLCRGAATALAGARCKKVKTQSSRVTDLGARKANVRPTHQRAPHRLSASLATHASLTKFSLLSPSFSCAAINPLEIRATLTSQCPTTSASASSSPRPTSPPARPSFACRTLAPARHSRSRSPAAKGCSRSKSSRSRPPTTRARGSLAGATERVQQDGTLFVATPLDPLFLLLPPLRALRGGASEIRRESSPASSAR